MRVLSDHQAAVLRDLCDLIVPGSARIWPEVYIDAVTARMYPEDQPAVTASIDALEGARHSTEALKAFETTPEFAVIRALAAEAFYSDFVAPGAPGPGAYEEIDFTIPLAARVKKDWSYLLSENAPLGRGAQAVPLGQGAHA